MTESRTTFTQGIAQHLWLLLSLKHDGRGLPSVGTSFVFMLAGVHTALLALFLLANPATTGSDMVTDFARITIWLAASYRFMALPLKCVEVFTGALMLAIVQYGVQLVLVLLTLQTTMAVVMLILVIWEVVAQLSLLMRHLARIRPQKNTKK